MRFISIRKCAYSQTSIVINADVKEQEAKAAMHSAEKKRKRRRTKNELETKSESESMYDTMKKSVKRETANDTRREVQMAAGRKKKQTVSWWRAGWEQGPEEKEQVEEGGCERSRGVTS